MPRFLIDNGNNISYPSTRLNETHQARPASQGAQLNKNSKVFYTLHYMARLGDTVVESQLLNIYICHYLAQTLIYTKRET